MMSVWQDEFKLTKPAELSSILQLGRSVGGRDWKKTFASRLQMEKGRLSAALTANAHIQPTTPGITAHKRPNRPGNQPTGNHRGRTLGNRLGSITGSGALNAIATRASDIYDAEVTDSSHLAGVRETVGVFDGSSVSISHDSLLVEAITAGLASDYVDNGAAHPLSYYVALGVAQYVAVQLSAAHANKFMISADETLVAGLAASAPILGNGLILGAIHGSGFDKVKNP
jgi:hypothetical protein